MRNNGGHYLPEADAQLLADLSAQHEAFCRETISEGFFETMREVTPRFTMPDDTYRNLAPPKSKSELFEQARVAGLLARDRDERRAESDRALAMAQLEGGLTVAAQAAILTPTPEQLASGEFRSVLSPLDRHTDAPVRTVRRVRNPVIDGLWMSGTLSDELYATCKWLAQRWAMSGLEAYARTGTYDATGGGGEKAFGFMPKTQEAVEARDDYRRAMALLPQEPAFARKRQVFEAVVFIDVPVTLVDTTFRCRRGTASKLVRACANRIWQGVRDDLDIKKILGC